VRSKEKILSTNYL